MNVLFLNEYTFYTLFKPNLGERGRQKEKDAGELEVEKKRSKERELFKREGKRKLVRDREREEKVE